MIRDKKSQTGTTITWAVAFIVVFFIIMIFLFFSSSIAATKNFSLANLFASKEQKYAQSEITQADIMNQALTFLNTQTGRDGKETIYDLLAKATVDDSTSAERKRIFGEKAKQFLEANFPTSSYSSSISLSYPGSTSSLTGYSIYNFEASSGEAPEVYSNSYSLSIPIISGSKLNLEVSVK